MNSGLKDRALELSYLLWVGLKRGLPGGPGAQQGIHNDPVESRVDIERGGALTKKERVESCPCQIWHL